MAENAALNRLGLYVHIPFCASKCLYCDFPSWPGVMGQREAYVEALEKEIETRGTGERADTVFIGGGTPSLLMPEQFSRILAALRRGYEIEKDAEITCEVNPGMASPAFLAAAKQSGVNRVSVGVQAFDDRLLALLGRRHTAHKAAETVREIADMGFGSVNIDLMFGLPGQTMDGWARTLDTALSLPVKHISCYALIPEEGTPLFEKAASGQWTLPGEDRERDMYDLALEKLAARGFHRYEISNFALPGHACRHNLGCWRRAPYHGFGCAAHSLMDSGTRMANPAALDAYLAGEAPVIQKLTEDEKRFEAVMLGLRTAEGVSDRDFTNRYGQSIDAVYGERLRRSFALGLVEWAEGALRLTDRGMNLENAVLLDLME